MRRLVATVLVVGALLTLVPAGQGAPGPAGPAGCLLLALDVPPGPAVDRALRAAGVSPRESFDVADTVLACGPSAALAAAAALPFVARAMPEEPLTPHLAEARALIEADLGLGPAGALPGDGVTIAMVDSAADPRHPGIAPALRHSVKFTATGEIPNSGEADAHGTHVAGILVGTGAGSEGGRLHGVAPGASLVALDISDAFTTTNALRAFEWIHDNHAAYGIRVVSNSWGRERDDARWDPEDPVVRASDALVADGLVVVFSAGNKGADAGTLTLEAMTPSVITVGATGKDADVEAYSSRGPPLGADGRALAWTKPDVVAPGTRIVSARANAQPGERGHYVAMNGTSMAAPQVAAAAAVLLAARPDLPPDAVATLLRETARDEGARGPDAAYGWGLLDVSAALRAATEVEVDRVVVRDEVRTPVHAQGQAVTAARRVLLDSTAPGASGPIAVRVAAEGAVRVDLLLAWDSATARPVATLTDGRARLGPWTGAGASLTIATDLPAGGPWLLEVDPGDAPGRAEWALDGHATSVVEREVASPGEARAWAAAARPRSGFFEEHAQGGAMRDLAGTWGASRNLQLAAALAVSALVVGRWKRV